MAPRTKRTPVREKRFLAALSRGLSVTAAATAAGLSARAAYYWRGEDAGFAARWDDALEEGTDALEDEALRRAVEGFDQPVYYCGREVGNIRKYSDALLKFLLRGRRPGKYQQPHMTEFAEAGDGPIGIDYAGLSELEFEQRLTVLTLRLAEVDAGAQLAGGDGAVGALDRPRVPADAVAPGAGAGKPRR